MDLRIQTSTAYLSRAEDTSSRNLAEEPVNSLERGGSLCEAIASLMVTICILPVVIMMDLVFKTVVVMTVISLFYLAAMTLSFVALATLPPEWALLAVVGIVVVCAAAIFSIADSLLSSDRQ